MKTGGSIELLYELARSNMRSGNDAIEIMERLPPVTRAPVDLHSFAGAYAPGFMLTPASQVHDKLKFVEHSSWFRKTTWIRREFCPVDLNVMFDFSKLIVKANAGKSFFAHLEGQPYAIHFAVVVIVRITLAQ